MKILYILSKFNIYGGTPKKTLDLMKYFGNNSVLYVYENGYNEFKSKFEETGGKIYEGFYGRNILKHLFQLLKIVKTEKIDIVQTQFFMGEILGFLVKVYRPKIKLIVSFVGSFDHNLFKRMLAKLLYQKVDVFIYISNYVKREKINQYPFLSNKKNEVIYNGTDNRKIEKNYLKLEQPFLLSISSLIKLKNIQTVIKALAILKNQGKLKNIYYYIAGEGYYRNKLESLIKQNNLSNNVFLIGNQTNIGYLLSECLIFLHPSYAEGFGIAVAEAMIAKKPIIVSNVGALPELINHGKTGLIAKYNNAEEWANLIFTLINDKNYANELALNAKKTAISNFSVEKFCKSYENLYNKLLTHNKSAK